MDVNKKHYERKKEKKKKERKRLSSELRSCVKVEVDVLGFMLSASVDVKQHWSEKLTLFHWALQTLPKDNQNEMFKGDRSEDTSWPENIGACRYVPLHATLVALSIFLQRSMIVLLRNLAPQGATMFGSLFSNEEQKNGGSWRIDTSAPHSGLVYDVLIQTGCHKIMKMAVLFTTFKREFLTNGVRYRARNCCGPYFWLIIDGAHDASSLRFRLTVLWSHQLLRP